MFHSFYTVFRSGVTALLLFVCIPGTSLASPFLDGAAMHRVGTAENLCALTFDDGPGKHTERLLDILAAHNVKATFFVIGERAARNPGIIARMVAEGHEVANHTYTHKSLRHMPEADQLIEIGKVQETLSAQGVTSRLLRPPFGRYDAATQRIVDKLGLRVALWSADSHDWQRRASIENIQSVYSTPARNGVILFHDTHQPTVDAMDEILTALEAGQCRFVTMSAFYDLAEARLNGTTLPSGHMPAPQGPSHGPVSQPDPARLPAPARLPDPAQQSDVTTAPPLQPAAGADSGWTVDGVFGMVRSWAQGLMGDPAPHATH